MAACLAVFLVGVRRQAEVGQLRFALLVDQHIGRLDVAVDYVVAVGVGQRLRQLADDLNGLLDWQDTPIGLRLEQRFQRAARDEVHGDVVVRAVLPGVEDTDDVGVRQPGRRPRLALETPDATGVGQLLRLGHLQGHHAP